MADKWLGVGIHGSVEGLSAPFSDWTSVSTSVDDSTNLPDVPRALYAHAAGSARCVSTGGSSATFTFAAGEIKALRPVRIMATNTSTQLRDAGNLIGLY